MIKRLVALILERAKLEANAAALERQARQAAIAAGLAQPAAGAGAGAGAKAPREPDVGGDKKPSSSSEDAGALKAEMRRAEDLQLKLDAAVTGAPAPPSALRIICLTADDSRTLLRENLFGGCVGSLFFDLPADLLSCSLLT